MHLSFQILLAIAATYFIGSIPFGLLFSWWLTGKDPRHHGSRNIGATNAMRTGGKVVGILTLIADLLKGALPVYISIHLRSPEWVSAVIAITALIGHCFPIYLGFKGGKGVATMFGVVLPWQPWIALLAFIIWLASLGIFRYVSASSILAACSLPLLGWTFDRPTVFLIASAVLGLLIIIRHRSNITRLLHHEEPRVGQKKNGRLRAS